MKLMLKTFREENCFRSHYKTALYCTHGQGFQVVHINNCTISDIHVHNLGSTLRPIILKTIYYLPLSGGVQLPDIKQSPYVHTLLCTHGYIQFVVLNTNIWMWFPTLMNMYNIQTHTHTRYVVRAPNAFLHRWRPKSLTSLSQWQQGNLNSTEPAYSQIVYQIIPSKREIPYF